MSKPEFLILHCSKHFGLKIFLSLELLREIVVLQHRENTGEAERMGDFAPEYLLLLEEEATDGVLPSVLEYTHRSCDAKDMKGMVLYKDAGDNRVLFVAKSALSNHDETLLSLFSGSITASSAQLHGAAVQPGIAQLRLRAQQGLHYRAFKAAVPKLFGAKRVASAPRRPFDTTQVKKDLKYFPAQAEVWN